MHPALTAATLGFSKSFKLCLGSAGSFFVANAMPDESMLKVASGVTGWILALACIWVLARSVQALFAKLEAKDELIRTILEKRNAELKEELDESGK